MKQAEAKLILESGESCFLTGEAGTGKSWLTQEFIADSKKKGKTVIVTASTGVAALNIGGATVHSTLKVFGMYPFVKPPKKQDVEWTTVDILIIDEVSMLGPDMLDQIDFTLRQSTGKTFYPFGGIQVICVGDLYQLPPVYAPFTSNDKEQYRQVQQRYKHLTPDQAECFSGLRLIELTEMKRQQEAGFAAAMNALRNGLTSMIDNFQKGIGTEHSVHLVPTNALADQINMEKFTKLNAEGRMYEGIVDGDFNMKNAITPKELHLKIGARVMVTKNDKETGVVNGDVGTVVGLKGDYVVVDLDRLGETNLYPVEWKQIEYIGNKPVEIGSYTQIPLKLAWAITVHKSQGLSLDDVCLHVTSRMDRTMLYVGASRAKTFGGLWINRI